MSSSGNKRRPRNPLSSEELARVIAFKKNKARKKLHDFKATRLYKYLNIYNVLCFFIYWEVLLCFFGPCYYVKEPIKQSYARCEVLQDSLNRPYVLQIKLTSVTNFVHQLVVNDFLKLPQGGIKEVELGKDYILHKILKGRLSFAEKDYRFSEANPILFLSVFLIVISCSTFFFNLNQHPYSLRALSVLNTLTILAFVFL